MLVKSPPFLADLLRARGLPTGRQPGNDAEGEDEMLPVDKDVLTTGEVAKICNVAPRTVSKWFDSGALKGYRIPGSKDRRIPLAQLMRFMKEHGIPFDGISGGKTRVLVVDDDEEILGILHKVLSDQANYEVRTATTAFEAGIECERFKPHVMVLDVHLGDSPTADGREVVDLIRHDDDLQMTRVIAMSGKLTDGQLSGLKSLGFENALRKPFQVRQVVEAIENATSVVH